MAIDIFMAYVGIYPDLESAEADYQAVHDLHTKANLVDAYDAAVVTSATTARSQSRTSTLATGLVVALSPFAAIGGGLLAATTAGGAVLGAVTGHAAAGMSRDDLKELGEHLDAGQAGLVVVGVSDRGAKIEDAIRRAEKVKVKELKADTEEIERDVEPFAGGGPVVVTPHT